MKRFILGSLFLALVLMLVACGKEETSSDGGKVLQFGTQTNTDPKIMAQIVKLLIEDQTDHEVEITEDIQASPQIMTALEKEEFDLAVLYSGEVYNNHFDDDQVEFSTEPAKTLEQAQSLFGKKYDLKWYDSIGFSNQYGIATQRDFAEQNNITKMSDLSKYAPDLTIGTDTSWLERPNDGYRAYQEMYGYKFGDAKGMQVSLMYQGIKNDQLDVVTAYTVDPQIIEYDLKLLEDDKNFFPPYEASLVARNKLIKEYPEVAEVLDSIVGSISTEDMTQLMYEVDISGSSTEEAAKTYLQEKGLIN
ncbi:glycine betaine ABC transporter substrate-binding protein [Psychrobacillus antarcticus]|uniref:ABC transporter substrate-binding protein n=1 Tax=Psychrobacillus antarcticus TaxID=2879115 RepID=UPI002408446A|nr:glycine betaine ABC transporter substrate-binding protein [Psychrobacillus antarcticus]